MSNISLLILIVSFSLFYLFLVDSIKDNHISNDLLFFVFIDIILVFSLSIFYFYFQDINLSFIISILLTINNLLILREVFLIKHRFFIITLPYFLYFAYISIFLLFKLF